MPNSTYNLIVFLDLTSKKKGGSGRPLPVSITYFTFLSLFILTQTTEIAATPMTPTTTEEPIRNHMESIASDGEVSGNTEKIGS